jgi:hypothetical protein
MFDHLRVV